MAYIIRGTEIKFNFNIEPINGVSMTSYDFEVFAYCAGTTQKIQVPKGDCTEVDSDNYVLPIDTSALALGQLIIDVYAYIPDLDFPDGLRTEICRIETDIKIIA